MSWVQVPLSRPFLLSNNSILNEYKNMGLRKFFSRKSKLDISLLPNHIQPLINKSEDGPNCWNATILFFHEDEEVRFVPPSEMEEWLKENTYVDVHKTCAPNTILAMYGFWDGHEGEILLHTAVYVNKGILFHKRGCSGKWELVTEKQLREIYYETTRVEHLCIKE